MFTSRSAHPHKQQGVVLVVSLLILLVLTLLGISSLDGSIMEEKMATNSQMATTTFQKAESSIRETFYTESQDPAGAYFHAENGETENHNETINNPDGDVAYELTAGTEMRFPPTEVKGRHQGGGSADNPLAGLNSEGGTAPRYIEIVGTASVGEINNRNIQGYVITGMMAPPN